VNLRRGDRPLLIGHKGASALEPENTLRSLSRAIELACDLVEFDVLELMDGTLVLAHSDDLLEVSHGAAAGQVHSQSLAALRRVAPELPTFDDALDLLAGADGVGIHVDLKWYGYEESAARAIVRHDVVERTLVSTCHARSLHALAALEPRVARGITYPFDRRGLSRRPLLAPLTPPALLALRRALPFRIAGLLERARASAAVLHHSVVSRAAVARAHARGAAVLTWTVDHLQTLERVLAADVDGVITNDPGLISHYTPGP
jgi:glycerophosphoryl diester phosphodiesterase